MKTIRINQEFTETEMANLLSALNCYENTVNESIGKMNDKAEAAGQNCLIGRHYGASMMHDLRLKLKTSLADEKYSICFVRLKEVIRGL